MIEDESVTRKFYALRRLERKEEKERLRKEDKERMERRKDLPES